MSKITEIREQTRQDVFDKLAAHHKCMIIRPTGYGKTWLLTELIRNYRSVLYLYPAEVIADTVRQRYAELFDPDNIETITAVKQFHNVTMMTYAKLIRLTPDKIENMDIDCIVTDEAHRIGAFKTAAALSQLIAAHPNADLIGATATPNRTDYYDVTSAFFNNVMVFPYTMHDAIQDGMLQKPNYCYCTYDIETDLKDAALTAGEDLTDPTVVEVLNKKLIELSDICGMDKIMKEVCDNYAQNTDYMKFIVFFGSVGHMRLKLSCVEDWLKDAYPDHEIRRLLISSSSRVETENVKKLNQMTPAPKTIDLIACIDMLNMGYHVNDLTGIIMYRTTKSDIIYIQQLGRVLSSGTAHSSIVFDVVDNLHRKAVYDLSENPSRNYLLKQKKTRMNQTPWHIDENGKIVDQNGNKAPVSINAENHIVDMHGEKTDLYINTETGAVESGSDNLALYESVNRLSPDDINRIQLSYPLDAEGHMATYRELIAKAVAEPMSQRCRIAVNIHFQKWCESMGIEYPISKEELDRMENVSSEDFADYFRNLLISRNIDYPLQDAEQLLSFGNDNSERIPMYICAKIKNVSVRSILDLLGIAA